MKRQRTSTSVLPCVLAAAVLVALQTISAKPPLRNYGRCKSESGATGFCRKPQDCNSLDLRPPIDNVVADSGCGEHKGTPLICCALQRDDGGRPMPRPDPDGPLFEPNVCGYMMRNRIYRGNVTGLDEFPWMALIQMETANGLGFFCGGSLISDQWVLTAAHCVVDKRVTLVRLGEWNVTAWPDCVADKSQHTDCAPMHLDVPVLAALPHPDYSPHVANHVNDIALLRLAERITFSVFVKPICLLATPSEAIDRLANVAVEIAGWGRTEHDTTRSDIKLKATLRTWRHDVCRDRLQALRIPVSQHQGCAADEMGANTCRGDSGGPLMAVRTVDRQRRFTIAGIISLGSRGCSATTLPLLYTSVDGYTDWIRAAIHGG